MSDIQTDYISLMILNLCVLYENHLILAIGMLQAFTMFFWTGDNVSAVVIYILFSC